MVMAVVINYFLYAQQSNACTPMLALLLNVLTSRPRKTPCRHVKRLFTFSLQDVVVGNGLEDQECVAALTLRHAIEFSYVSSWDCMEKIWHHLFQKELGVSPENHPVLIAEPPMNPKSNREKTTEIMFERFCIPSMYLAKQAVLSLYHAGSVTGVVLQSGDGFTFAVPIYEGCSIPSATLKMPLAGRELTQHLKYLLSQTKQTDQIPDSDWGVYRKIKETLCYVAEDFKQECSKKPETLAAGHMLSDGQSIDVKTERFACPEALFQPRLCGLEFGGIHEFLQNSVQKCHDDIQKEMYDNVFLSGGNTMFPGIVPRLQNEISKLVPPTVKVTVHDMPGRHMSAWRGGSMMASEDALQSLFIQRSEYDEYGPTIVHRKCYL